MLATITALAMTLAGCHTVERQCRACVVRQGHRICSRPGIACQPRQTVCRARGRPPAIRVASPTRS